MRRSAAVLFLVLLLNATQLVCQGTPYGAAENSRQKLSDPSVAEVAAHFKAPPPEYGMTLWWGWDGPVTEEVITRDLDRIKAMGFTSVMIEAGNRMQAKYLSPEWFKLIQFAVGQARQRDMRVWAEDEGKYPSGFVGGKFSEERPDLRMQALVRGETIEAAGGQTIERKMPSETVSAVAYNAQNNTSQVLDIISGELKWTAPDGKWQIYTTSHVFRTSPTRSVNNPNVGAKDTTHSLGDYMNPEATRQILAWTHEEYKKAVGDEFGRTFMGFMGDEPDYSISGLPWTPRMLAEFESRKGYDVRPYLAWFFESNMPDEARRAKADYWDVWSDLFAESYFKVLADWCAANNVQYIVHLNHEEQLMGLVRSEGDYFKNMRHVAAPGIDVIWSQIWMDHVADYPKLASSAAHLFGRPRAFTESFAAYKPAPNVEQATWILNYQLVRGINMVQVMFMSASSGGRGGAASSGQVTTIFASVSPGGSGPPAGSAGARGGAGPGGGAGGGATGGPRRGSFFTTAEFPPVAAYIHRASYLLSQGRPAAQIAVYMPTTSLWLGDDAADKGNLAVAQKLLEQQRDFDWVDEQSLCSVLKLEGAELKNLSGQSYRAVIVPPVSAISKAALDRLETFAKAGGHVIFLGREPSMVVEKSFLKAGGPHDLSWAVREPTGELTENITGALPKADVALDRPCPSVKYTHQRWRDAELYFFFNESTERQSRKAVLAGNGQVDVWDTASGRIERLAGVASQDGSVTVPLELGAQATRVIVVGAATGK